MAGVLVLVAALGAGGAVALWPLIVGEDSKASLDAGLAAVDPGNPPGPLDAGILVMEPMGPDAGGPKPEPVDAGVSVGSDPGRAATPGADPVRVAVGADPQAPVLDDPKPDKIKPDKIQPDRPKPEKPKTPRRRTRRRRTSSCSTRGNGTVDVGVSGGWAFVYIDGRKVRTTPLINYQVKAGRRRIELRDGGNKLMRRWDICLRNGKKVKLLHQ